MHLPHSLPHHLFTATCAAGNKIYLFNLFRYSSSLPIPPLLYRWFCPCKPPNVLSKNQSLRVECRQVDHEGLDLMCHGSPRSLVCLHTMCLCSHICLHHPAYHPSFLFHLGCGAQTHPHFTIFYWLALEDEESNSTFDLSSTLQSVIVNWLKNVVLDQFSF